MTSMSWEQFVREKHERFQQNVQNALKTLVQQKHLYQSVLVQPTDAYQTTKSGPNGENVFQVEHVPSVTNAMTGMWLLEAPNPPNPDPCWIKIPDVKLFCVACERVEPYNLVYAEDVFRRIEPHGYRQHDGMQQQFLFAYRCQSCKGTPEVFLIRRRGLKLTIEGRSPIEHVPVPPFIPKAVQRFFGGGIVAHQSGQTLAGVFLLRTLIEQWARVASDSKKEQADQVMEDYMATLPDDFKTRFQSMRTLYGELSVDIHTATGSPELFDKAAGQIVEHFDARRMFKL